MKSSDQVILAVAYGEEKTIIYKVNNLLARAAIYALRDGSGSPYSDRIGGEWNNITNQLKLRPFIATNVSGSKLADKAQDLEMDADYWINLDDPNSWDEALGL